VFASVLIFILEFLVQLPGRTEVARNPIRLIRDTELYRLEVRGTPVTPPQKRVNPRRVKHRHASDNVSIRAEMPAGGRVESSCLQKAHRAQPGDLPSQNGVAERCRNEQVSSQVVNFIWL
jgi:hypothetical protein